MMQMVLILWIQRSFQPTWQIIGSLKSTLQTVSNGNVSCSIDLNCLSVSGNVRSPTRSSSALGLVMEPSGSEVKRLLENKLNVL